MSNVGRIPVYVQHLRKTHITTIAKHTFVWLSQQRRPGSSVRRPRSWWTSCAGGWRPALATDATPGPTIESPWLWPAETAAFVLGTAKPAVTTEQVTAATAASEAVCTGRITTAVSASPPPPPDTASPSDSGPPPQPAPPHSGDFSDLAWINWKKVLSIYSYFLD